MIAPSPDTRRPGFWRDLTGQSDRWLRTLLLAVVIGRLSLVAAGILILAAVNLAAPEDAGRVTGQYSGLTDVLTAEWIFIALVFAPLTESLAIRLIVWLLGRRPRPGWPAWATATASALLAIPLHGLGPLSLAVAPFFALMAAIQHHWMNRGRGWAGFWLITAIHFAANAIALLTMALLPSSG